MATIARRSPVQFKSTSRRSESRDNRQVTLEYDNEGNGPYLVDLSHRQRLDLQDSNLSAFSPLGLTIPDSPGSSILENGVLINRMNRTQASILHLCGDFVELPEEASYTDVTESTVCLGLINGPVFSIMEKLSALDFMDPDKQAPFLFQGPFCHLPCQIMVMSNDPLSSGCILTCSRGYANDIVHAILEAGNEFGMAPAGEDKFTAWINRDLQAGM